MCDTFIFYVTVFILFLSFSHFVSLPLSFFLSVFLCLFQFFSYFFPHSFLPNPFIYLFVFITLSLSLFISLFLSLPRHSLALHFSLLLFLLTLNHYRFVCRIEKAKIMIANTPMDTDKIKIYGSRVSTAQTNG